MTSLFVHTILYKYGPHYKEIKIEWNMTHGDQTEMEHDYEKQFCNYLGILVHFQVSFNFSAGSKVISKGLLVVQSKCKFEAGHCFY